MFKITPVYVTETCITVLKIEHYSLIVINLALNSLKLTAVRGMVKVISIRQSETMNKSLDVGSQAIMMVSVLKQLSPCLCIIAANNVCLYTEQYRYFHLIG